MGQLTDWTKKGPTIERTGVPQIVATVVLFIFFDAVAGRFFGGSFIGLVITALAVLAVAFAIRLVVTRATRHAGSG
jgi:hypothetical protein